ncbi:hypothetical protein BCR33DRAFT_724952 [Rhizoclosmatium globosum]|uniref:Extracellular membrane protein CFEM domain-containing protein n=1 Tax=Rhizoclosmatium globosum TaxID=329046 RepID=A0A1Y2B1Z4_9FUNG|nr:hypothetical protein BCR33DRAFT_724952 [Rhizoclosmatium globosum]|eukprot:ORY28756.1 hypothetical protein BCR33DRAFT_724952 [Rhizoclosmatium globosum]
MQIIRAFFVVLVSVSTAFAATNASASASATAGTIMTLSDIQNLLGTFPMCFLSCLLPGTSAVNSQLATQFCNIVTNSTLLAQFSGTAATCSVTNTCSSTDAATALQQMMTFNTQAVQIASACTTILIAAPPSASPAATGGAAASPSAAQTGTATSAGFKAASGVVFAGMLAAAFWM